MQKSLMVIRIFHDMAAQDLSAVAFLDEDRYLGRYGSVAGIASGQESKRMLVDEGLYSLFILFLVVGNIVHEWVFLSR